MKLIPTEEQNDLRDTARQIFTRQWPASRARAYRDGDRDVASLHRVLADTGILSLTFPENTGGGGGSLVDMGVVFEEAGRSLCPSTVYTTLAFAIAMHELTAAAKSDTVARALSGEIVATTALWNPSNASDVTPTLVAERRGETYRLSGTLEFVRNATLADVALVSARTAPWGEPAHTVVCLIDPRQARLQARETFAHDAQSTVHLFDHDVTPDRIVSVDTSPATLARIAAVNHALQCADMVGGGRAVLDQTVDYVKTRHQFDRPLGAFQAVQHHVANMRLALDGAGLVTYQALFWLEQGDSAEREVAIAKLQASDAYRLATETAHQLHGGIGLARESDLHMWSERAKSLELLGGSKQAQVTRLADQLRATAGAPRRNRLEGTK